jgi:hypothetical protein
VYSIVLTLFAFLFPVLPTVASDSQVDIVPSVMMFGPWPQGETVIDTVIKNVTASSFTLSALHLAGKTFVLSPSPVTSVALVLPAEATLALPFSFSPQELENYASTLEFTVDDSPYAIPVSGEGVDEAVVINEILADPPTGDTGDANRDGTRHTSEDEFIELLNITRYPIDLAMYSLSDRGTGALSRFRFPTGTLI